MPELRPLDPEAFDALVQGPAAALWGAKAVAQACGVSEQTVRRSWVPDPTIPVTKRGGRVFAWRHELHAWLAGAWVPPAMLQTTGTASAGRPISPSRVGDPTSEGDGPPGADNGASSTILGPAANGRAPVVGPIVSFCQSVLFLTTRRLRRASGINSE